MDVVRAIGVCPRTISLLIAIFVIALALVVGSQMPAHAYSFNIAIV